MRNIFITSIISLCLISNSAAARQYCSSGTFWYNVDGGYGGWNSQSGPCGSQSKDEEVNNDLKRAALALGAVALLFWLNYIIDSAPTVIGQNSSVFEANPTKKHICWV